MRDSHYNRRSNKEVLQEQVALLGPVATVFTIFKGFVATAVLFIPFAFVKSGFGFSAGALFLSLIWVLYSIKLLLETHKVIGGSLPEMGERSWGKGGKILSDVMLFSSQFSFCLSYVYFIVQQIGGTFILCVTNDDATPTGCDENSGINLTLAPQKWLWVAILTVIFTPLVWVRRTEKFAFTHIFADIMVIIGLTLVTIFATKEIQENGFKELKFVTPEWAFSVSYAVFAFEGVGVVLPIMEITENKEQYYKLLTITLIFICLIFVAFCEYAAFAFGEPQFNKAKPPEQIGGTHALVLQNLPQNGIVSWVLACLYSLVVVFTYPLQIAPANNVLESYIFGGWPKSPKRQWGKNLCRMLVVFSSCVLTVSMYKYISELLEIASALTAIPMAFTLPALFHLKVCADTTGQKVIDWSLVVSSIIMSLYCAYNGI